MLPVAPAEDPDWRGARLPSLEIPGCPLEDPDTDPVVMPEDSCAISLAQSASAPPAVRAKNATPARRIEERFMQGVPLLSAPRENASSKNPFPLYKSILNRHLSARRLWRPHVIGTSGDALATRSRCLATPDYRETMRYGSAGWTHPAGGTNNGPGTLTWRVHRAHSAAVRHHQTIRG